MNYPNEQTLLIPSNRDSVSSSRLGRPRGGLYTSSIDSATNPNDIYQNSQQQSQTPLFPSLANARRHEQAHIITNRHWVVLLLACFLLFGNYYCYDIPAALNVQLQEWLESDYPTHQYHLNLLYSAYSLPNIVLPVIGGFLIDRLSASRMLIVFSVCICVGQGVFAFGVSTKSIWTMLLGRFIFGVGGECLEVAQAKITTDWFRARWLGFALGLNLSFARLATAMNDNISPAIAVRSGVMEASWAGFAVCVLCTFCGVVLSYLDRTESRIAAGVRTDIKDRKREQTQQLRGNIVGRKAINMSTDSTMTLSSVALEDEDEDEKEIEMAEDDKMIYSQIFTLKTTFWILCLCCISLYGAIVPFIHISSDFLQKKWYPFDPRKAGTVMSIPDIVSSVGSPLCGYFVDRFGNRARYIPLSAIFLIWAHIQLGFTNMTPIVSMIILGLAYSLFASVLWPCIPFLVEDHQLGTAYGIVTIALNISLTIFPMTVAYILDITNGSYIHVEVFLMCLALAGLLLSILLNYLDHHQGGHLQSTEESTSLESQILDGEFGAMGYCERNPHLRHDYYDPREPGFEYRRNRLYSQNVIAEDPEIDSAQSLVTTKPVGEGIIAVIPHRRRNSLTGFAGQMERTRLSYYAHHAQGAPSLNRIPNSIPNSMPRDTLF